MALLSWGVILGHLLLYGKWFMWHGGYAWGPRFMVPTLPFFVLAMVPTVEWAQHARGWRWAVGGLALLSGLVQMVGLSVHFELFQTRLLDTGLPLFDPVTFFDPRYSPLIGQLQFLRLADLDFAWVEHGEVNWLLLAALTAGVGLTGWRLARLAHQPLRPPGRRSPRVSGWATAGISLLIVALAAVLLNQAHRSWPPDLRDAVDLLNTHAQAAEVVVTGSPDEAEAFADLYTGHAPVLGLEVGSLARDAAATTALQSMR